MDLLGAEQRAQFGAGAAADLLEPRAAGAEDDRLLAVARDEDLLVDRDRSVAALLIFFGLDRAGIRQLGMELEVELLARHLGGEHPVGGVGDLVLGEMPRPFRHAGREQRLELRHAVAGGGGDEQDMLGRQPLLQRLGEDQQGLLGRHVDLVEDDDLGFGPLGQRLDQRLDALGQPRFRIDDQCDHVRILGTAPRRRDHRAIEPAARIEDAGRVDQQDLALALDRDAHQADAGGLRLRADDRDLLPDERVDEGGLAGIGRADHGDEAATLGHFNSFNRLRAASVSASCLELPLPSALARPGIETVMVKTGAWWGPPR